LKDKRISARPIATMGNNLRAGEFYGQVPKKRIASAATLTEVVHTQRISLPKHSHERGHFQLLLAGSYSENFGGKDVSGQPLQVSGLITGKGQ